MILLLVVCLSLKFKSCMALAEKSLMIVRHLRIEGEVCEKEYSGENPRISYPSTARRDRLLEEAERAAESRIQGVGRRNGEGTSYIDRI